jgi:patatin-like phospholipase/acyl hydrolase
MSKRINILSIDGGGIRGILPATFLSALEERLQQKTGKDSRLAHHFDLMAGTSTGGLLNCVYLCPDINDATQPRFSAKQALDFYFAYGSGAFKPMQGGAQAGFHKYSPDGLEAQLNMFFKDLKLSQLIKPCCVTAYDLNHSESHLFLSHKAVSDPREDYYLRSVSRATSALPGIFPPATISSLAERSYTFIDGSIFAYNPALFAFVQAKEMFPHADEFFLLSLGTGHVAHDYSDAQLADSSDKNWAQLLADIAFSAHSDMVNYQLNDIFRTKINSKYLRLQPSLQGLNKEMDDVSPMNLQALFGAGQDFVKSNEKTLTEIVDILAADKP